MGKGLPIDRLVKLLSFPAPMHCRSKHQLRDTDLEPLSSAMADIKVEACLSEMDANCHEIPRHVSGFLVQRSMTYLVYRETYTPSKVQKSLREVIDYPIKRRIDMTHNARFAKLSVKETLDGNRGIRSTESRMIPDKTPCQGYATEWSVSFHGELERGRSNPL